MKRHLPDRRWFVLAAAIVVGVGALAGTAPASDGSVAGSKTLEPSGVCEATVTIALEGTDGIQGDPADIVLVLDRSGSMAGPPLTALKSGATGFVDQVEASGALANGSRIGVVSFDGGDPAATLDAALASAAGPANAAIESLVATGGTNHAAGIDLAELQLAASSNKRVMIIFTDGASTLPAPNPAQAAQDAADAAKAADPATEIFTIGLGSAPVASELQYWATDNDHYYEAPSEADLAEIFDEIGAAIVAPAATNITVTDAVDSEFTVDDVVAGLGTASIGGDGNDVVWTIDELGTERATLTYKATGTIGGLTQVSTVSYQDDEGRNAGDVGLADSTIFLSCSDFDQVTTCEGGNCESSGSLPTSVPGQPVEVSATVTGFDPNTQIVQTSLSSTPAACAGFQSILGVPGATLDVLPLGDKLVVRTEISKALRKQVKFGIGQMNICLSTNLPFKMKNGQISEVGPDGRYAGLLPKGKNVYTVVSGEKLRSPSITERKGYKGGALIVFEVRAPYDPSWWMP